MGKQGCLFEQERRELARRAATEEIPQAVFTVGHSTRPIEEFIDLLQRYRIQRLVDIRHFPGSRHNPQFNQDALAAALRQHGIEYHWLEPLGGYRHGGYQAHMQTEAFQKGIEQLEHLARDKRTAYMCAELKWWRCHRRHVSDVLARRGWTVIHIMTQERADPHVPKDNPIRCD